MALSKGLFYSALKCLFQIFSVQLPKKRHLEFALTAAHQTHSVGVGKSVAPMGVVETSACQVCRALKTY